VHPSVWDEGGYIIMLARSPHDLEALKQTSDKVRRLIRAFPRAYYYLSIVKNEYPESLYAADAAEKLAMIERQTERYRHIIESFITHAVPAPRVKRL
jgi:outer membrane protein assembly factor BamD (BamD/ComL family)